MCPHGRSPSRDKAVVLSPSRAKSAHPFQFFGLVSATRSSFTGTAGERGVAVMDYQSTASVLFLREKRAYPPCGGTSGGSQSHLTVNCKSLPARARRTV